MTHRKPTLKPLIQIESLEPRILFSADIAATVYGIDSVDLSTAIFDEAKLNGSEISSILRVGHSLPDTNVTVPETFNSKAAVAHPKPLENPPARTIQSTALPSTIPITDTNLSTSTVTFPVVGDADQNAPYAEREIGMITPNQPPLIAINTGTGTTPGGIAVITNSVLNATDPDDDALGLTFTRTSISNGYLQLSTAPEIGISSFTQADINAGIVQFVHTGIADADGSFSFSLADGGEDSSAPVTGTFLVTISDAVADFYATDEDNLLTVAALGLLLNDSPGGTTVAGNVVAGFDAREDTDGNNIWTSSTSSFGLTLGADTSHTQNPFGTNSNITAAFDSTINDGGFTYGQLPIEGEQSGTLEAWVYIDTFGDKQFIFDTGSAGTPGISLLLVNSALTLQVANDGGGYTQAINGITLDTWHHIAVTVDVKPSTTTVTVFVNGVTSLLVNADITNWALGDFGLGNYSGTAIGNHLTGPLKGQIAHFRVHDQVLSTAELAHNIANPGAMIEGGTPISFVDGISTTNTAGTVSSFGSDGSFTYDPNSAFEYLQSGQTATDTFDYTYDDGSGNQQTATATITVNGVNDAPTLTNIEVLPALYTENNAGVGLTGNLSVADIDDSLIESATVSITANFETSEDILTMAAQPNVAASYNSASGVLTLTGPATPAEIEAAIHAVTYSNISDTPTDATRTVEFVVYDGDINSLAKSRDITIISVNDQPTITANSGTSSIVGGTATITNTMLNVFDPDDDNLTYYTSNQINGQLFYGTAAIGPFTQSQLNTGLISFVHDGLSTQNGSFDISISDGGEDGTTTVTDTFVITITGALPDAYTTDEDTTLSIPAAGLLTNDSPGNGATPFVLGIDDSATLGSVAAMSDGSFDYTPNGAFEYLAPGQTATDSFDYTYDDGNGVQQTVTTTITIEGVNDAPTLATIEAQPALYTENNAGIGLTGNLAVADIDDSFIESATVSITGNFETSEDILTMAAQPNVVASYNSTSGVLTLTGPATPAEFETAIHAITYSNNSENPTGATRTVEFVVNDGDSNSIAKYRNITIIAVNDQLTITDNSGTDSIVGGTATITNVMLNAFDPDDDNLLYTTTNHTNGQLYFSNNPISTFRQSQLDTGFIKFVHDGLSTQNGSFDISISDDGEDGTTAVTDTFVITITGALPDAYTTDEDTTLSIPANGLLTNDSLGNGATPVVASIDDSATLGSVSASPDGSFDYNPNGAFEYLAPGQTATDTFDYTYDDGNGIQQTVTATITISGVNDAPKIVTNNGANTSVGGNVQIVSSSMLNESDSDDDGIELTYTVTSVSNGQLEFTSNPGTAITTFTESDKSNALVVFVHDGLTAQNGSFDFTLADGGEDGATKVTDTFVITITGALPDAYIADEDTTLSITADGLLTNDSPGNGATPFVASIGDSATLGSVSVSPDGSFDYNPNGAFESLAPGQTATDTFDYTYDDGNGAQQTVTTTITIEGVNDAPTLTTIEAQPALYTENASGVGLTGNLSVDDIDDSFIESATVSITTNFETSEDILTIAAQPNVSASYNSASGVLTLTGPATATDFEAAFHAVTYSNNSDNPSPLTRTVEFIVNDGDADSVARTRDIEVTPINDQPLIAINTGANSTVGATTIITNSMLNEGDPDDSGLGIIYRVNSISNGHLEFSSNPGVAHTGGFTQARINDGTLVFVHDGLSTQNGSFDFSVEDGLEYGTTPVSDTFVINVTGALPDSYTTDEDTTLSITAAGLLTNDSPGNGATPFVASIDDSATLGSVSVNPNGSFDYNPNGVFEYLAPGQTATDTFDYTYNDGNGIQQTVATTITIGGVNDAPTLTTIEAQNALYTENDTGIGITGNLSVTDIDDTFIESATVSITGNFETNSDLLFLPSQPNINSSYNAINGVLTLTAQTPATVAEFETALHAVTYSSNSDNLSVATRTVEFAVNDGDIDSFSKSRDIQITAVNDPPLIETNAGIDSIVGGTVLITTSLLNEGDPDDYGFNLNYSTTSVSNGQLEFNTNQGVAVTAFTQADIDNGILTFVHDGLSTLNGSFDFSLADGGEDNALPATGTFVISVAGALPDTYTTDEDSTLTVTAPGVLVNDSTGTPATVANIDDSSTLGSVSVNSDGSFVYDPNGAFEPLNTGQSVTDTFDYTYDDGNGSQQTVTATVTITGVNDAPVLSLIESAPAYFIENNPVGLTGALSLADSDDTAVETATLSIVNNFTAGEDVLNFTDQLGITGSFNTTNGVLTLTGPATVADFETAIRTVNYLNNSDDPSALTRTVEFVINDGDVDSSILSRDIEISPRNDSPLIATNTGTGTTVGGIATITNIMLDEADPDDNGIGLTYTATSVSNGQLEFSTNLGIAVTSFTQADIDSGTLIFVHDGLTILDGSFDFTLADGGEDNATPVTGTFLVSVAGALPDSYTVDEDSTLTVGAPGLLANDSAGTVATIDDSATLGSVSVNTDGSFVYQPNGAFETLNIGQTATDSFDYTYDDGNGSQQTVTATVTITGVNDAPVLSLIESAPAYFIENNPVGLTGALSLADSDDTAVETATLSIITNFIAGEDVLNFTDQLGITGSFNTTNGVLTLTGPATVADFETAIRTVNYLNNSDDPSALTRTVEFVINDGDIDSLVLTRDIEISPTNDSPLIATNTGTGTTVGGIATITNIMLDEADPDDNGIGLTYTATSVSNGQLELSTNLGIAVTSFTQADIDSGTLIFVHDGLTILDGSFDFTLTDGGEDGAMAVTDTFVINITGALPDAYTTDEETTLSIPANGLLTNDSPGNGATPFIASIDDSATLGSVSVNPDGSFDYNPNGAFEYLASGQTATDAFDYTYDDGNGIQQTVTTTITIEGVNDAPTLTTIEAQPALYTENNAGIGLTGNLAVADIDDYFIESATVSITGNFETSEDILTIAAQPNVSASYDTASGVLTLTGPATAAEFEAAFHAVTYSNNSDNPSPLTRTVEFIVNDGDADSVATTRDIEVTPINDQPLIAINTGAYSTVGATTIITNSMLNEGDPDDSGLGIIYRVNSISNGHLEFSSSPGVAHTGGFTQARINDGSLIFVHDGLSTQNGSFDFSVEDGLENGTTRVSDTFVINVTGALPDAYTTNEDTTLSILAPGLLANDSSGNGTTPFVVSIDDSATIASVSVNTDGSFTYNPDSAFESLNAGQSATDTFDYTYDDGNGIQQTVSAFVAISGVNDGPIISSLEAEPTYYFENGTPAGLTGNLNLADVDDTQINTATLSIINNFVVGEDVLKFSDQLGITGSYIDSTGVLTLIGPATPADFETAIHSVGYLNNSDDPSTLTRTLEFVINDGDIDSNKLYRDIEVLAINDPPAISINTGASSAVAETTLITNLMLNEGDPDDNGNELTYNITSASNGQLELTTAPGIAISTFTQADINSGALTFVHDGLSIEDGSFDFILADGGEDAAVTTLLNQDPTLRYDAITGKFYRFVDSPTDITTALNAATTDLLNGVAGQLVTIDSEYENQIIQDFVNSSGNQVWLGASDATTPGTWNWLDGTAETSDTFWTGGTGGAPVAGEYTSQMLHSSGNSEDYIRMLASGYWTDDSSGGPSSYVVEWLASTIPAAPVADTFTITVTGALPDTYNTLEDSPLTIAAPGLLVNDSVSTTAGVASIDNSATLGTVSVNTDGSFVYLPNGMYESLNAGQSATDSFDYTYDDGNGNQQTVTALITISGKNDAPALTSLEASPAYYTENGAPVGLTGNLTLTDIDNALVNSATLSITNNFVAGEDVLYFSNQLGITSTYDATSGVLLLTGPASLADFETAIHTVSYANNSDNPSALTRTVEFVINDENIDSNVLYRDIEVSPVNDSPFIITNSGAISSVGGIATITNAMLNGGDPDDDSIDLTYTATSVSNGQLEFNTAVGTAITTFTQADIDAGVLTFVHDGLSTQNGSFDISLFDGGENDSIAAADQFIVNIVGALSDFYTTNEDSTLTIAAPGLLANDSHSNTAFIVNLDDSRTLGSVSVDANGGFVYQPNNAFETLNSGQVATDTFDYTYGDGSSNQQTVTAFVTITGVNDSPVLTTIEAAPALYTENETAIKVTENLSLTDIDDAVIETATLSFVTNFVTGEDTLTFSNQLGITGDYDTTTGVLSLTGPATPANFQEAIRTIGYINNSDNPSTLTRTLEFVINDKDIDSNVLYRDIAVLPINDSPRIATNTSAGSSVGGTATITPLMLNEGDPDDDGIELSYTATSVSNGQIEFNTNAGIAVTTFTQSDIDAGEVTFVHDGLSTQNGSFEISLFDGGEDSSTPATSLLTINVTGALSDSYTVDENNSLIVVAPGLLINDSPGTAAFIASVDDSATIGSVLVNPDGSFVYQPNGAFETLNTGQAATDSFDYTYDDGNGNQQTVGAFITIVGVNDSPTLTSLEATPINYFENGSPIGLTTNLSLADLDDTHIESATISIVENFMVGDDILGFNEQLGVSGNYNVATGVLTLSGPATVADFEAAIHSATYFNNSDNPSSTPKTVEFSINDGDNYSSTLSRAINISAINDAPILSTIETTAFNYTENTLPVEIASDLTYTDLDNTLTNHATIAISNNYIAGEDKLSFSEQPGITGTFDTPTGILTLIGNASTTDFESALRSITFETTSENPSALTRTVDFSINDGVVDSNTVQRLIDVYPVNDAPSGTDGSISLLEDTSYVLTQTDFGFTDQLDSNAFQDLLITQPPTAGQLLLSGVIVSANQTISVQNIDAGELIFKPAENTYGNNYSQLSFLVIDDGGIANNGSNTAAVSNDLSFDVINVNDPPTGGDKNISILEDTTYTLTASDFSFSDTLDNNEFLAVTITTIPDTGTLSNNAIPVLAGDTINVAAIDNGALQFTPSVNQTGQNYNGFSFLVHDSGGNSNNGQFVADDKKYISFDIAGVNDAPLLISEGKTVDEGSESTIGSNVLSGTDVDDLASEDLSFSLNSLPVNGVLSINGAALDADSSFTLEQLQQDLLVYTHDGSETDSDFFDIQISDGGEDGALPAIGRFNLTINEVIDPAPIISNEKLNLAYGASFDTADGDLLDSGASALAKAPLTENPEITISIETPPKYGNVIINNDGTFAYLHDGTNVFEDSFSYRVTNEDGISAIATVAVSIEPSLASALAVSAAPYVIQTAPIVNEIQAETEEAEKIEVEEIEEEEESTIAEEETEEETTSDLSGVTSQQLQSFSTAATANEIGLQSVVQSQYLAVNNVGILGQYDYRNLDSIEVKNHNSIQYTTYNDPAISFSTTSIQILADITITQTASEIISNESFLDGLLQLEQDLEESDSSSNNRYTFANDTAIGVSLGGTAGILAWALRGGSLFASLMTSTPLWSSADPIRVTGSKLFKDKESDEVDKLFEEEK